MKAAPLGFWLTAAALAVLRNLVAGEWLLFSDDANWISSVRLWCGGTRLYADLWHNKGPLFFLFLRPICLVAPRSSYSAGREILMYWLPILALYTYPLHVLAARFRLAGARAFLLGGVACLLVWNGVMHQFFATEHLATALVCLGIAWRLRAVPFDTGAALAFFSAGLCNWRFLTFGLLYLLPAPPRARAVARDAGACALWLVAVLALTTAFDRESLYWLGQSLFSLDHVPALTMGGKLETFVRQTFFARNVLTDLLVTPFGRPAPTYLLLSLIAALSWRMRHTVRALARDVRFRALLVCATLTVGVTGQLFDHAYVAFFPLITITLAAALTHASRAALVVGGTWCALSLAAEGRDLPDYVSKYRRLAQPAVLREGKRMSDVYAAHLGGRRWIALLRSDVPYLLADGVARPENRLFRAYCNYFPRWSEIEIAETLARVPVRVALHTVLAEKDCLTADTAARVRARCAPVATVNDWLSGRVEFFDCPAERRLNEARIRNPPERG